MNKKLVISIAVFALVIIAGCSNKHTKADNDNGIDELQATDQVTESNNEAKLLAGSQSGYYTFTQEAYEQALKDNKVILLYFYANWCPICKLEEPKARQAFNELNDPNIVGFRVNYKDSDTDKDEEILAKEFQIPYQHTKVIIKDGKQVLKAPDSWGNDRYIQELTKVA